MKEKPEGSLLCQKTGCLDDGWYTGREGITLCKWCRKTKNSAFNKQQDIRRLIGTEYGDIFKMYLPATHEKFRKMQSNRMP